MRIIQRHYPIDRECNPRVKTTPHAGACTPALAALCSDDQNRGAEQGASLVDGEAKTKRALTELARSLHLDGPRFEKCLDSKDTKARLQAGIERAIAAGVRATPTLFIDPEKHVGRLSIEDVECLSSLRHAAQPRERVGGPND